MKKEYLKNQYYAKLQYKGFYKDSAKYDSLEKLEKAINGMYQYYHMREYSYSLIDYVIYEIKPIKRLLNE